MFNLGGRQMEKMMKQLGIATENVPAEQVIIRGGIKDIVIDRPSVTKVKMGDQETFQIIGEVSERPVQRFSADDAKLVAAQTGASEAEAARALNETGDIAAAILKLKKG